MKIVRIFEENYPNNKKTLFTYTSDYYYDLNFTKKPKDKGWIFDWTKKPFKEPFVKRAEGVLFEEIKKNAKYYMLINSDMEEIGLLGIEKIQWNSTTRIWDVSVEQKFQRCGYGTKLLEHAEKLARSWDCRAMVVECQSSNYIAIQFYLSYGFEPIGFDLISYSNQDIQKKEVRIEMGKIL